MLLGIRLPPKTSDSSSVVWSTPSVDSFINTWCEFVSRLYFIHSSGWWKTGKKQKMHFCLFVCWTPALAGKLADRRAPKSEADRLRVVRKAQRWNEGSSVHVLWEPSLCRPGTYRWKVSSAALALFSFEMVSHGNPLSSPSGTDLLCVLLWFKKPYLTQTCLWRIQCRTSKYSFDKFSLEQGSQTQVAPRAKWGLIQSPEGRIMNILGPAALWRWRNNGGTWTLLEAAFRSYFLRKYRESQGNHL